MAGVYLIHSGINLQCITTYTKPFIWKSSYSKAPAVQRVEFGTTKATYVPANKTFAAEIAPHIYSALIYLHRFPSLVCKFN